VTPKQLRTRRNHHAATPVRAQVAALTEARVDRRDQRRLTFTPAEAAAFLREADR
jgi:hypothetical protein